MYTRVCIVYIQYIVPRAALYWVWHDAGTDAASTLRPGVAFPTGPDGRVSTTAVAKQIWCAAAGSASALAAAILAEPDWRHKYPRHLVELESRGFASCAASLQAAHAGLAEVRAQFTFNTLESAESFPLADMPAAAAANRLCTASVAGTAPLQPLHMCDRSRFPAALTAGSDAHALTALGLTGTCEPSVGESVLQLLGDQRAGQPGEMEQHENGLPGFLARHVFVLLGGTSELCPYIPLAGATVVVVKLARLAILLNMAKFTATTTAKIKVARHQVKRWLLFYPIALWNWTTTIQRPLRARTPARQKINCWMLFPIMCWVS